MMQTRGIESLVEQHQQELIVLAASRRAARRSAPSKSPKSASQRSAAGIPVTGGRAVRRAVRPRVGGWLIAFGTRLGGTPIRTSSG